MERILKTVSEILRSEFPKDSDGFPFVMDRRITGWMHGDRQIISNNELPAIVFDGGSSKMDWATFHAYERVWNFSIINYVRTDEPNDLMTLLNEMTRLSVQAIRKHSKMWIFEQCLFDLDNFHSPTHLLSHAAQLAPLAAEVRSDWATKWNLTHRPQGSGPVPSAPVLGDEEAYVTAYLKFYNSTAPMALGGTFAYYDAVGKIHYSQPRDVYLQYNRDNVNPVRLLSFVKVEDVQYSFVPKRNNQFLRASEIKVSAREIDPVHEFGPNNVSDPNYW